MSTIAWEVHWTLKNVYFIGESPHSRHKRFEKAGLYPALTNKIQPYLCILSLATFGCDNFSRCESWLSLRREFYEILGLFIFSVISSAAMIRGFAHPFTWFMAATSAKSG